jgi:hypothetical protein
VEGGEGMTGPEHLREGKRLLVAIHEDSETLAETQAVATVALAHLTAAQVCAYVAAELPERVSWTEASET